MGEMPDHFMHGADGYHRHMAWQASERAESEHKHDTGCMRRREDPKRRFLCTCGLTDEEIDR